ncbi:DUF305 domain-containing protein [Sphingomonas sp. DT-51]|uniref:DUF305 domain-containing protein n=1 Tax=Sphingomonas sp. DT-51 TaxID=3396165 RepID=UPI003F1E2D40
MPNIRRTALLLAVLSLPAAAIAQGGGSEKPFLDELRDAMDRMMAGMETKPTGDVDRDFVAMMIPHHQGAIDMAVAELRHGRDERLKRIAQEIIVDQQQEIAVMKMAVGDPLPASAPAPTTPDKRPAAGGAGHQHHSNMES